MQRENDYVRKQMRNAEQQNKIQIMFDLGMSFPNPIIILMIPAA